MGLFLLCLKIFFVRILDVSLGTVRTIVTIKGKTKLASMIGFVEVFIWFVIVKEALNTPETSIFIAIAYAAGYASGTAIGSIISDVFIERPHASGTETGETQYFCAGDDDDGGADQFRGEKFAERRQCAGFCIRCRQDGAGWI